MILIYKNTSLQRNQPKIYGSSGIGILIVYFLLNNNTFH